MCGSTLVWGGALNYFGSLKLKLIIPFILIMIVATFELSLIRRYIELHAQGLKLSI